MIIKYKHIAKIIGLILLIPIFGNLFIKGWKWGLFDFVFAFIILFITGVAIDFTYRKVSSPIKRFIVIGVIVFALLVVWVEIATDGVSRKIKTLYSQNIVQTNFTTEEYRFTGEIQEVIDYRDIDGNLNIKVNDKWINLGGGDIDYKIKPVIINFDLVSTKSNVGKTVEVYAKGSGYDQSLTILDDSKYYIKIIK